MKHPIALTLATLAIAPMMANASAEELCVGQNVTPGPDGRMLGHISYGQASMAELVSAPAGFAVGQPCYLRPAAAADLARMLAAAAATPGMAGKIRSISCYRTVAHQRAVFCSQIGPGKRCRNAAERARAVGPPGYSEHATGYAIDFGTRPLGACGDVSACFGRTAAGQWLLAHAADFGFELSFPDNNAQGVTWEPWHWRWVGVAASQPGASTARAIFARARRDFPASPNVADPMPMIPVPPMLADPSLWSDRSAPGVKQRAGATPRWATSGSPVKPPPLLALPTPGSAPGSTSGPASGPGFGLVPAPAATPANRRSNVPTTGTGTPPPPPGATPR